MEKKSIKNIFILIIILYVFYLNKKIQIINHSKNLITFETKISVIIPIYNGGKYIDYSLSSVQKQKMKDIEIIIVDDNSNDDSLKIIQNYMKKDKRIKLIKNHENRRILFCKSIGALISKGKFIIEIDQDDMFIRDDTFDILYEESEKYKLDILNFAYISGNTSLESQNFDNFLKNKNIIQKRTKSKSTIFKDHISFLWGNLILSDLYKKVIYNIWPIIINYKIIFQEDFLITFFILIYTKKYETIKNKFYFHFVNIKSASNNYKDNSEYYLSVIFAGIIFFDYYIDYHPQEIQILINYINIHKLHFMQIKKLFPNILNYFFGKIFSNGKLSKHHKNKLMTYFNISENCDSYIFLNENISTNKNELSLKESNVLGGKVRSIELSIILVYSNYENIIKIINSINIQNREYLEVILIYDDENKKDYNLLDEYIKSYSHIKLIDNEIKRGTFFSISKGVKIAKGKYLLILNQNCFFINNKTIQTIYDEIENNDADILEFNLYKILPNNYMNLYKCKHFVSRFNFSQIKNNLEYNDVDIKNDLLTNKLFKTNYFKKLIKIFNVNKIKEIIDYSYNNIFAFMIESTSHKYKYINSINLYINDIDCDKIQFNDFTSGENKIINETIFYINFIYDNSKNTYESKEKVLKEFFNFLSIIYNKFTKISKLSLKLLNKFFNCKYISKTHKNLLKFYYNALIN